MKHSEFKELVLRNMPENPNPGPWKGSKKLYNHILWNPAKPDKAVLINKYSLIRDVPEIDLKTFKLHQFAHHLNSSQIMCYNFFRPLMVDYNYNDKMYKPTQDLINLIEKEIGEKFTHESAGCNFEYVPKDGDHTNFDFYFRSNDIEVFFEIKYTEREFSKHSSAKDPVAQFSNVYKPMINNACDIFLYKPDETNFNDNYYQLARNAIRVTSKNKYVFFICPNDNENLIRQFHSFSKNYLNAYGKKHVRLITWEELTNDASKLGINVENFKSRYLNFLHENPANI